MQFAIIATMVLWTTARHEALHALAAMLEGSTIERLRLLPGIHPELGFYFGLVEHRGETTWLTDAAPFIGDVVLVVLAIWLARRTLSSESRRLVRLFLIVSPLIDLGYAYQNGLWREGSDVFDLLDALPAIAVHVMFIGAIAASVVALRLTRRVDPPRKDVSLDGTSPSSVA